MTPANPQQLLRQLDSDWVALLQRHGFAVRRETSSWVSYDGADTIAIAPDLALDHDDCLAQIVLHELCHHWVEGAASRRLPDWGLDNTNDEHVLHEEAALALQAALADRFALRNILVATTCFRPYYEALPADPLAELPPAQRALVERGIRRASACPIWKDCRELLARCADLLRNLPPPLLPRDAP